MRNKKFISILLAAVCAFSMAACSKKLAEPMNDNNGNNEATQDVDSDVTTEVAQLGALGVILQSSDTSAKSKDNDFVIAMEGAVSSLDPANIPDTSAISATRGIYETLVKFDERNQLVGGLAKSWDISEDSLTYTFHLREGIKFHDDTDFNAEAIKANYDRVCNKDNQLRQRRTFIVVNKDQTEDPRVANIDIPDANTIVFTLSKPWSPFINRMTQFCIISPKAIQEYGNDIMYHPCGTGPYVFEEWKEGDFCKFKRNDNYWGEKPGVDTITLKTVPEAGARTAMLQTGEADLVYPMPADQIKALDGTNDVDVIATESNIMRYVTLNMDLPQLKDVKVRQAMNYAIDQNAYVKVMYDGHANVAKSLVPSIIQGYQEQPAYEYDIAKAKELLKEAGYENGFDLTIWGDNSTQEIKGMTFVKQQLEQIGIKVDVQAMDPATVGDKIYVDKDKAEINMWYVNWSASDYTMDGSMRALLYSTNCPPVSANTPYYNNPEFDRLLDEGLVNADTAKQAQIYADAQKIAWEDCPWLFLANDQIIFSRKNYLSNVFVAPDGSIDFAKATLAQ